MLKWTGAGFLDGVPARDLTDEEVSEYGGEKYLLDTGLYEKPEDEKPSRMTTRKTGKYTLTNNLVEDEKGNKE